MSKKNFMLSWVEHANFSQPWGLLFCKSLLRLKGVETENADNMELNDLRKEIFV